MSRSEAWSRRAGEATGSRRVTAGSVDGGLVDDIDALLAEEESAPTAPAAPDDQDGPPTREPSR
ncbi:hypothetical protein [Pseudonocardia xishanensis]|uniref:Uncharacterized protein n=1 Tax=Pseudonocardia xishanensis TaxID=630995 RepID=A0ABP8RYF0_9PSEU